MQQFSSTLFNLGCYIALVALGAFLGSRAFLRTRPMPWLGRLQTAALLLLIVTLGAELGVASLATIGLNAFVITITSMIGSMLAVHALRRWVLKLDKQARTPAQAEENAAHGGQSAKVDHTLTILIVITVAVGMLAGYFVLPPAVTAHCGQVINLGL